MATVWAKDCGKVSLTLFIFFNFVAFILIPVQAYSFSSIVFNQGM